MTLAGRFRVDTVPAWLKPPFWLYRYGVGLILAGYSVLIRATARVHTVRHPAFQPDRPHILCVWHQEVWMQFLAVPKLERYAIMGHPLWYMAPIYVMLRFLGLTQIVMGSSGHDGRKAAEALVICMRDSGYSTIINPDGPQGPMGVLRKGALHLAASSGAPIVPLSFRCQFKLRARSWDRKWLPLPYARIDAHYGEPLWVRPEELESAAEALQKRMGVLGT